MNRKKLDSEDILNITLKKRIYEIIKTKAFQIIPTIVLALILTIFGLINKNFLSLMNFRYILLQLSIPLVLSLGLTFVILMGSIDLSVDGVMALGGALVSLLVLNTRTSANFGIFGIIIAIGVGGIVGAFSGIINVKAKLPSFIITFGVSQIALGLGLLSYQGAPAKILDPMMKFIASNIFLGIPFITWVAFGIFISAFIILKYTAFGRYIYAIGNNEAICRLLGIKVDRVKIKAFILSGLCISIAGIIGASRIGTGDVTLGMGNLFPAITAVTVGGTSLSGGKGGVVNALIGALIVVALQNGMVSLGIGVYVQAAVQGLIIITAVVLSSKRNAKEIIK